MELADNIITTIRQIKEGAQIYRDSPMEGQGQSLLNAQGFQFLEIRVPKNRRNNPGGDVMPRPGGPLTTSQPVEYKWMSGYSMPLQKIGQSLLCTGSSTQIQNLYKSAFTCPKQSNIIQYVHLGPETNTHKTIITTLLQLSPNNSIVD